MLEVPEEFVWGMDPGTSFFDEFPFPFPDDENRPFPLAAGLETAAVRGNSERCDSTCIWIEFGARERSSAILRRVEEELEREELGPGGRERERGSQEVYEHDNI